MENNKSYSYNDIADFFIALSNLHGDPITNLKLQKLVYYAQAWYLANFKKPLFTDGHFQAWVHGPVIPELYAAYKNGSSPIVKELDVNAVEKRFDKDTLGLLHEVALVYMPETAYKLEQMTHEEAPWISARKGLEPDQNSENIISEAEMESYYGERLESSTD